MTTSSLVPAEVISDEANVRVKCLFNPKEYTVSKQNSWSKFDKAGKNMPQVTFGGGQPATLQMELFFDTYADCTDGQAKDVRKEYTDKLWGLMATSDKLKDAKTKKARPPIVRFHWGHAWSFDSVITSLAQKFTLFLSDGTPVRATVTVTFEQIKDVKELAPPQNPTSGGVGAERLWTVSEGDTLAWIAFKEYGDSKRWRAVADANRLTEVRNLRPGMVLVLPNG